MKLGSLVCVSMLAVCTAVFGACAATPDDLDDEEQVDGEEPAGDVTGAVTGNVGDAAASSCTTASVKGLSQQIIDEAACIDSAAFVKLPEKPNLVISSNIFPYLEKPARDALVSALDKNPSKTLTINSMLRTVAQQYLLYRWYQTGRCGISLAAKPGNSNHETGLALDTSDYVTWKTALTNAGFAWLGSKDAPHFDYKGAGAKSYKGMDVLAFQRLWNRNHPEDKISEDGDWGPQTESRLKKAPAAGFAKGASCGAPQDSGSDPASDPGGDPSENTVWTPAPGTTWQWILSGSVSLSADADAYDIDGFDASDTLVKELHAQGRKAICYLSAGSYEDWRPDAADFPSEVLGKDYEGWAGEKWLDIRRIDLLAPILTARLDMCKQKGFDAIEPDNIDGYTNDTGFPLSYSDQITFNKWLADRAHERGMSIGLKNDPEQVADLLGSFDWALTEDCVDGGWCESMSPFINANKAVFAAEYTDTGMTVSKMCATTTELKMSGILKKRELDAWISACP